MNKYLTDIKKMSDDQEYYNGVGKKYLSNSAVGAILRNPATFLEEREDNANLALGRYFHQLLLEPDKIPDFPVVEASNRNTNIYKNYVAEVGTTFALLQHEVDHLKKAVNAMRSNMTFHDLIYDAENKYEVPMIKDIFGVPFKGKADIVAGYHGFVYDLKTTSDINKFGRSAYMYGYDSQAFIYQELFDMQVKFLVVDKETFQIGMFDVSQRFLASGEEKVKKAIEIYERFFTDKSTEDVEEYFIQETLY